MKKWRCLICKYVHEGDAPPEKCPICKAPAAKFVEAEAELSSPEKGASPAAADTRKSPGAGSDEQAVSAPAASGSGLFDKFAGLLSRGHAHPISVHLPNGVLPVALAMFVLAWLLSASPMATAGFYNLVFVMLALPLVIFTGFVDWERKYRKALTTIFMVKIVAAGVTFTACLISLVWYLFSPGVLGSSEAWLFLLVNGIAVAAAGVAGHIGGKLVFRD